ncbi:MAG: histidine phosphatase family protein [Pseudomonadota bacterium]
MELKRRSVLRWAAAAALALGATGRARATEPVVSEAALQALSRGELALLFRHAATTWSGVDRIEWPRARQRLLSEEGIAQSRRIGAAARTLGAPIGEVLASPFARCRDMAEIAFGRVEERRELLGLLSDAEGRAARVAYLTQQLARTTGSAGNRVIVTHRSNIAEAAGAALGEGDGVWIRPLGGGRFETLATLAPEDWTALAAL